MSEFARGDAVLVRFPFSDASATKVRPAVVISVHGEDYVAVGVFSTAPQYLKDCWVLVDATVPSFVQTGLKVTSVIKCEKLMTIHSSLVHRKLGSLPDELMSRVVLALRKALEID